MLTEGDNEFRQVSLKAKNKLKEILPIHNMYNPVIKEFYFEIYCFMQEEVRGEEI